jgi:hypothetical protein
MPIYQYYKTYDGRNGEFKIFFLQCTNYLFKGGKMIHVPNTKYQITCNRSTTVIHSCTNMHS